MNGENNNYSVLKNFTETIPGGKITLIIGKSGIGKTTLLNLLLRFMDPKKGTVSIDGQNLKDLKFSFRDNISLCP